MPRPGGTMRSARRLSFERGTGSMAGVQDKRETDMRALAQKLQFKVDKTDSGFTLTRTAELDSLAVEPQEVVLG
jgi:hypothetical protein